MDERELDREFARIRLRPRPSDVIDAFVGYLAMLLMLASLVAWHFPPGGSP